MSRSFDGGVFSSGFGIPSTIFEATIERPEELIPSTSTIYTTADGDMRQKVLQRVAKMEVY
jgi:hypothetical protein